MKSFITATTSALFLVGIPIAEANAINYAQLVPIPSNINSGLTSPSASYMKEVLGSPGSRTKNCNYVIQNPKLKKLIVTESVGPFRVTGLKPALDSLRRVFSSVKKDKPELYSQLQSNGMFCIRSVAGTSVFSNHSWGTGLDLKIQGRSDLNGDRKTQLGLRELYPYFKREGFYWGASFPKEDAMHFEASKELIEKWRRNKQI